MEADGKAGSAVGMKLISNKEQGILNNEQNEELKNVQCLSVNVQLRNKG